MRVLAQIIFWSVPVTLLIVSIIGRIRYNIAKKISDTISNEEFNKRKFFCAITTSTAVTFIVTLYLYVSLIIVNVVIGIAKQMQGEVNIMVKILTGIIFLLISIAVIVFFIIGLVRYKTAKKISDEQLNKRKLFFAVTTSILISYLAALFGYVVPLFFIYIR